MISYSKRPSTVDYHSIQRLLNSVTTIIQAINLNVQQIESSAIHIGTPRDSEELRRKLATCENHTNQLAKDANKLTKELETSSRNIEDRTLKLQKERLLNDLMKSLHRYQEAQKLCIMRQKESNERAKANMNYMSDNQQFQAMENQNFYSVVNPAYDAYDATQAQIQIESNVTLEQLKERERSIRKLETDIENVNKIFQDLAVIVHQQGEVIDSIEANISNVVVHVDNANGNLTKAVKLKTSTRRKKVYLALIIISVICVIVLIIVLSLQPWK